MLLLLLKKPSINILTHFTFLSTPVLEVLISVRWSPDVQLCMHLRPPLRLHSLLLPHTFFVNILPSFSFFIIFFWLVLFLCNCIFRLSLSSLSPHPSFSQRDCGQKVRNGKRLDAWGIPICSRLVKNSWICNVRWISWWGSVETKEPVECVPVLELVLDVAWVSIIWLTATVLRESQWKGVVSLLVNLLT